MASFPFDLYRAIGEDRYVSPGELPPEAGDTGHALWEVYDRHFGRFTGAGLDPAFARFARADVAFGQPTFPAGTPVIVAGGGAGLDAAAADLRGARGRILVVTAPSSTGALQRHGITPDLVIVEREPGGREDPPETASPVLGERAALLIEPSAPVASFERGAGTRRLSRDLPSWGVWPATAVAVALRGGATRLVTVGLGGATGSEEAARAEALLAALALHAPAECLELGGHTARAGWWPTSWPNVLSAEAPATATLGWCDAGGPDLLRAEAERDLHFLAPLLPHARDALALARRARTGHAVASRDLTRAVEMLLLWGADPGIRWALQRALGLTFLPRLWRTGVSMASPQRLWRPIVLALHELIEQADRFESRLTTLGHAQTRGSGGVAPPAASARPADRRTPARVRDRVSVVVPVVDDHPHLDAAIASLAEQTYAEVEILIVHDAARAPQCEPLRALPLSNVRFAEARSFVEALNVGLEAATGAWLVCHGADDLSHPQRLARQLAYLHAHPDVGVLATAIGLIDDQGRPLAAGRRDDAGEDVQAWTPEAVETRLRTGPCFEHGSVLVRRELVTQAGGYRPRAGSPPDHDLWLRLLGQAKFAKLPTRLYYRRQRA
jgi:glycosyl transferase family 2